MVTAELIKTLREKTGAGMMDCKKALTETNGDLEKATVYLREKGLASAAKKSSRTTAEGAVGSYIHMGGKIGVLVEVNCETDFVAKNTQFQNFVKDIAMHIAASNPSYVSKEDVPEEVIQKEREILKHQAVNEGKPENIAEKMVEGRIKKYYKEICLAEQPFIKDGDISVSEYVKKNNGEIISMIRYEVGEGMEKRSENFAEEVMAQVKGN